MLVEEEEKAKGAVRLSVLKFYSMCAGGLFRSAGVSAVAAVLTGTKVMVNYWLLWWTGDALLLPQDQYLSGYLGLTLGQTFFTGTSFRGFWMPQLNEVIKGFWHWFWSRAASSRAAKFTRRFSTTSCRLLSGFFNKSPWVGY